MKGTTLYGKPTGKGGFTNGDLTVSRTGNDNRADGKAKSSAFQKTEDTVKKVKLDEVPVSGGDRTERASDKFARVKKETDASTDKAGTLSANYGGTWKMGTDKAGNRLWLNQDGQNVKEAAISQSKARVAKIEEYKKKNTTR